VATINNDYFEKCAPRITCDPNAKYRIVNGSCNNLQNPSWGAALTPFYRYMDPVFSDGNLKKYFIFNNYIHTITDKIKQLIKF